MDDSQPQNAGQRIGIVNVWKNAVPRTVRRIIIFVIGMTVLLFGAVLLVTPGPGILGIVAGLAILATEFAWAGYFLRQARKRLESAIGRKKAEPPAEPVGPAPDKDRPA